MVWMVTVIERAFARARGAAGRAFYFTFLFSGVGVERSRRRRQSS
jgi:hypothetical protein